LKLISDKQGIVRAENNEDRRKQKATEENRKRQKKAGRDRRKQKKTE
jgi:hypothetical protein